MTPFSSGQSSGFPAQKDGAEIISPGLPREIGNEMRFFSGQNPHVCSRGTIETRLISRGEPREIENQLRFSRTPSLHHSPRKEI